MDAIKKKMQSLKSETDNLLKSISSLEEQAKSADDIAQQCECDIRDISKKITMLESDYDIANDQYNASIIKLDETEKSLKVTEEDVNAMTRRQALMETFSGDNLYISIRAAELWGFAPTMKNEYPNSKKYE